MSINDITEVSVDGELSPTTAYQIAVEGLWSPTVAPPNYGTEKDNILLDEFGESPYINSTAKAPLQQQFDIKKAIEDMVKMRDINQAFGWWLDMWGQKVGEKRNGRNDVDYKRYIVFKIFLNRSSSTPDALIEFIKFYTGGQDVVYTENPPAKIDIEITGGAFPSQELLDYLQKMVAGGVKVGVSFSEDEAFGFDDENGHIDTTATAFDEENYGNPDAGPIKEEIL